MPRYFFNLNFGGRVIEDNEGIEFLNRSIARNEALAALRDFADPPDGQTFKTLGRLVLASGGREGRILPHSYRPPCA